MNEQCRMQAEGGLVYIWSVSRQGVATPGFAAAN